MTASVRNGLATLIALASVAACHRGYEVPSLAAPHALVKLRLVYHATPGTKLEQSVLINDHALPVPAPAALPGETAQELPIRPEAARINVSATFSHAATTMRPRAEQYVCGTRQYECGTGMCTGVNYCERTVLEPVETLVGDGGCVVAMGLAAQRDVVYRLQYDYFGSGRCTLACLHEARQPDGTLRLLPCEPLAAH